MVEKSGNSPRSQPSKQSFSERHPKLALALQLGVAAKVLEKISESGVVEQIDSSVDEKIEAILPPEPEYFVSVAAGDFVVGNDFGQRDCRKLYLSGTNKCELVEAGASAPYLYDGKLDEGVVGPEVVRRLMEDAKQQGLDFVRFNAFAVDPEFSVLTGSYGTSGLPYNEAMLRGLDYVVDQARHHGLRVLLTLTDYFADEAGGPLQYMQLGVPPEDLNALSDDYIKAAFYSNTAAQGIFTTYITALATRVNSVNGRTYASDPAILGWDIMNEPRCDEASLCNSTEPGLVHTFVANTYSLMKALVQQPVTVGLEGFYDTGANSGTYPNGLNPYPNAGAYADFADICALVDFCEFNLYPDQWNQENEGWVSAWVAGHSATALQLGKPTIVKEQGAQPTRQRSVLYSTMYTVDFEQIVADRKKTGGLKGAAFFQAWVPGTKAVAYTLAVGGRYGVLPDDQAARYVRLFSEEVAALSRQPATCPQGANVVPVVLPLPRCKPGFEGPTCEDINECVRGTDDCSKHAACINTDGSYQCRCYRGYFGDGRVCAPAPIHLQFISESFYTKDTINCALTSEPVAFPRHAPGWVYDPTGFFQEGYDGNRVPITLQECKTACLMSEECTSFLWDAGLETQDVLHLPLGAKKCLLRKNECPFITSNVDGCQAIGSGIPTPTLCTDGEQYTPDSPAPPTPTPTYECGRAVTYFKKKATLPAGCTEQVGK